MLSAPRCTNRRAVSQIQVHWQQRPRPNDRRLEYYIEKACSIDPTRWIRHRAVTRTGYGACMHACCAVNRCVMQPSMNVVSLLGSLGRYSNLHGVMFGTHAKTKQVRNELSFPSLRQHERRVDANQYGAFGFSAQRSFQNCLKPYCFVVRSSRILTGPPARLESIDFSPRACPKPCVFLGGARARSRIACAS